MNLLSETARRRIDTQLSGLFSRYMAADEIRPLVDEVRRFVLNGGKRLRPQLCIWTYDACGGTDADPDALYDLACGWELFHAFLLVHDDIIDAADQRRQQRSLHRQLEALDSDSATFGVNLGIVAGDLLFSMAMRLWHDLPFNHAAYRRQLQLFSRVACETGFGQAIDICTSHQPINAVTEQVMRRGYDLKTAAYTFEGPMLSGALAGNLNDADQRALSRFALALGQAYQIHNDLLDLNAPASEGGDLMQGKRTLTLLRARDGIADLDDRLARIVESDLPTADRLAEAERLRRALLEAGAARQTQALLDQSVKQAETAVDDVTDSTLQRRLAELLQQITATYLRT